MSTLQARLEKYSIPEPNSGCLLWTGCVKSDGYGRLMWKGKARGAHRLAYEVAHGPIPADMCVCHKCDVPSCINVAHLWLGSHDENMKDMGAKGRLRGGNNANCVLNADQIRAIRAMAGTSMEIAARFGISASHVKKIRRRLWWRHVI